MIERRRGAKLTRHPVYFKFKLIEFVSKSKILSRLKIFQNIWIWNPGCDIIPRFSERGGIFWKKFHRNTRQVHKNKFYLAMATPDALPWPDTGDGILRVNFFINTHIVLPSTLCIMWCAQLWYHIYVRFSLIHIIILFYWRYTLTKLSDMKRMMSSWPTHMKVCVLYIRIQSIVSLSTTFEIYDHDNEIKFMYLCWLFQYTTHSTSQVPEFEWKSLTFLLYPIPATPLCVCSRLIDQLYVLRIIY